MMVPLQKGSQCCEGEEGEVGGATDVVTFPVDFIGVSKQHVRERAGLVGSRDRRRKELLGFVCDLHGVRESNEPLRSHAGLA